MIGSRANYGATLIINAKLLYAFGLGTAGFFTWPTEPKWWGLGIISIGCGLSAFALTVEAMKSAVKLYRVEKTVCDYSAQGSKPKQAYMATEDDLKKAGMR